MAGAILLENAEAIRRQAKRIFESDVSSGADISRLIDLLARLEAEEKAASVGMQSAFGRRVETMSLAELDHELALLEQEELRCPHCNEVIE